MSVETRQLMAAITITGDYMMRDNPQGAFMRALNQQLELYAEQLLSDYWGIDRVEFDINEEEVVGVAGCL